MEHGLEVQRERFIRMLIPEPTLTGHEIAERSGIDFELAQRMWRALGMPHVEGDQVAFSQEDLDALKLVKRLLDAGLPVDGVVSVSRVLGQSMARIADAQSRFLRARLADLIPEEGEPLWESISPVVTNVLEVSDPLQTYVYHRHLAVALQHLSPVAGETAEMLAAGFADMVGFSRLSDDLGEADLGDLISRFEEIVISVCSDSGVRLVKIVGDAVMFVTADPVLALQALRNILDAVEADPALPEARAGLDIGPVLPLGGDYFGRPVNVASRLTEYARPGTALVSRGLVDSVEGTDVSFTRVGPRRLKNVGRVSIFRLERP